MPSSGNPLKYLTQHVQAKAIQVFRQPEPDVVYCIGVDTAEGLTWEGKSDACSVHVLADRGDHGEEVCHLHGRDWDTHTFGQVVQKLGYWYNEGILVVERNNHGHAVLDSILKSGDGYSLLKKVGTKGVYCHHDWDNDRQRERTMRPGFPTNVKTKVKALDDLNDALLQGELHLRSARTIDELMRFVHLPGGKAGGEAGSHDDRVMSLAMAVVGLRIPKKRTKMTSKRKIKMGA